MAEESGNSDITWTNDDFLALINDGSLPDIWDPSMSVSFRLLKAIIDACEASGKIIKHTLPTILTLLKPNISSASLPRVSSIKEQLKRKKNLAHPDNVVPWLEKDDPENIGPYCTAAGITASLLRAPREQTVGENQRHVNNGVILELRTYMVKNSHSWTNFCKWICNFGISETVSPADKGLERKIYYEVNCLFEAKGKLPRGAKRKPALDVAFMDKPFLCPEIIPPLSPLETANNVLQKKVQVLQKSNDKLTEKCCRLEMQRHSALEDRKLALDELDVLDKQLDELLENLASESEGREQLLQDLAGIQARYERCKAEMEHGKAVIKRWDVSNSERREKRKDSTIQLHTMTIEQLSKTNADLMKDKNTLSTTLTDLKKDKYNLQKKLSYFREKAEKWKLNFNTQQVDVENAERASMKQQIEVDQLCSEMEDLVSESYQVPTTADGMFTDVVRATCMSLHSLGVGIRNIPACIQAVASQLFGLEVGKLPVYSTIQQFLMEANILGKLQVGRAILGEQNNTLHLDGTTDHQHHYVGFQASISSGSMTMAMLETECEDTEAQMRNLQAVIGDYAEILGSGTDKEDISGQIALCFKNLMTDQHIVNKKFKEEFENLRLSILERTYEGWQELPDNERQKLASLNQWFCLLHVLLGIGEALETALKEYEAILTSDGQIPLGRQKKAEANFRTVEGSLTAEAIRSACALVSTLGHPGAGIPEDFKAFINSRKLHFTPFKHNRFNILTHNAVATVHHHADVLAFLELTHHENQLVHAVQADLQDDKLLSLIRAVAIFHMFITAPLHRIVLLEDRAPHILDMNPILRNIQLSLEALCVQPALVINPGYQVHPSMPALDTGMFASCLPGNEDPNIDITLEALGMLSTASLVVFTRQMKHQLPKGELTDTDTLRAVIFSSKIEFHWRESVCCVETLEKF